MGSEMCIRDRTEMPLVPTKARSARKFRTASMVACPTAAWVGGRTRPGSRCRSTWGSGASSAAIGDFRADLAFLGTNGISVQHGLSTPDAEEAATKRALVESAQRVIALTDATKVGQERTIRFAALEDIDVLVTDDSIEAADAKAFEAAGLDVIRA